MWQRVNNFFGQSLHRKILSYLLLASLVPLILLSIYTLKQIKNVSDTAILVSNERLKKEVIILQEANLNNQAQKAEQELRRIEDSLRFLRRVLEIKYANDNNQYELATTQLIQDQQGFYWNPGSIISQEGSSIFLSNITALTPKIIRDINISAMLDEFFFDFVLQNENIVAVYYVTEESLSRIYPPLDFHKLISEGKLPADMRVQEYPFYYTADPINNAQREIVWTESYLDVTYRGWMISSLAPIYLPDDTFKGIIGADVTFELLAQNIINPTFEQPNAYAFLIDNRGNLLGVPPRGVIDFGVEEELVAWNMSQINALELRETFQKMVEGKRGTEILNLSGEDKYLLYAPLPTNGWSLAFVIPEKEIVAPINADISQVIKNQISKTSFNLILAGILITLAVTTFSFYISWKLIQPITKLIAGSRAISQGRVDHTIEVDSADEIGVLARSFNEMAVRLKDLISALKEETQKQVVLNYKLHQFNKSLEDKVDRRTIDLQKKNEELEITNEKLKHTEEARRTLIANISHDLRTPFTSVQGFIEALQDEIATSEQQKSRYLNIIYNRIIEINKLLDDLFLLSQLQARQEINLIPVSGYYLIENLIKDVGLEVEQAGFNLEKVISPNLPTVEVDPDRLRRVFNNIIQNATEHSKQGGKITISTYATEQGDLEVKISDTGTGIPAEDLPYIFERFYKIGKKEHRTGKGAGLGLAIAKEIVAAHNGVISVESEIEVGTTFIITLKRALNSKVDSTAL